MVGPAVVVVCVVVILGLVTWDAGLFLTNRSYIRDLIAEIRYVSDPWRANPHPMRMVLCRAPAAPGTPLFARRLWMEAGDPMEVSGEFYASLQSTPLISAGTITVAPTISAGTITVSTNTNGIFTILTDS